MKEDFSVYNGEGKVLRKAQLKMLDILTVIDEICQKHNIPYWIDYGTLLGAVRHKGFIPWDDDLDISVLYSDYALFKKVLSTELPADLAFQDWISEPKIAFRGAKIRDKNSYYNDGNTKRGEMEYQGVFVDVFPIYKIPSKSFRKNINYFYGRSYRRIRGFKSSLFDLALGYLIWPFALFAEQLSHLVSWIIRSRKVGNIYGGLNFPCVHLIENIFPLIEIEFEGRHFKAPNNTNAHLTEIYNNYMWIPPVDKREVHASEIIFFDETMRND